MVFTLSLDQAQVSIKIDKPFYYPGETIKGVIYLKIKTENINAGLLYIKLCGQEKVNQVDKYNQFFSFKQFFYKKQKKITNFGKKMPIVACKKYFEMEVPNSYPSFTINYYKQVQCRILYFLSVSFQGDKGIYKPPKRHRVVVHIIQKPSPNVIQQISQKGELPMQRKCCFQTGISKIQVILSKQNYVFGEDINIKLIVDNNNSNVAISKFQFVISSQLIILYSEQKRKLSNYFVILEKELQEQIPAHSTREVETSIKIEKSNDKKSIFPQTTIKTKQIVYQYILTVNGIFQKTLFMTIPNLTVVLPISIFQTQKREHNNIIQSMDNLSVLNSQSIFDTQKINQSQIRKIIYSDHNWSGYGEQDGYDGPERTYNPVDSLDEAAFLGVKGAMEQLFFKKQYEDQEGSNDEQLIDEIEGNQPSVINLNQIQLQTPQTIFSQQNQQQETIFNTKKNQEIEFDEVKIPNRIQDQLQTIREEQDSKGTQYNLNHLSSSGLRRNNSDDQQFESQNIHHRVETFGPNLINNEIDESRTGEKIVSNLKKNKVDSNSNDQQQSQEQKDVKQKKVQFHETTSADTIDGKNIEKQAQLQKYEKQQEK